jgi:hypothetical protein
MRFLSALLALNKVPFFFAVPLKAKNMSDDWDLVCHNLQRTVENLSAQTDPNFSILIVCNDVPSFLAHRRRGVEVVTIEPRIQNMEHTMQDRLRKRRAAGAYLKAKGVRHCYFMPADADDLVHRDLVRHVHATDNRAGYLITKGYGVDEGNSRIARIDSNFQRHCGTCAVLYFKARDLPSSIDDSKPYLSRLKRHARFAEVARKAGRTLEPVDFHAAIYMINHGGERSALQGNERTKSTSRAKVLLRRTVGDQGFSR